MVLLMLITSYAMVRATGLVACEDKISSIQASMSQGDVKSIRG